MTVAAWVLLLAFSFPVLTLSMSKMGLGLFSKPEVAIWMASAIIATLAAGVIWGGLGG